MGSVAAGPLLSRLLNYRTVSFQALRHRARSLQLGWLADISVNLRLLFRQHLHM